MNYDDDPEFEQSVRDMLERRAADIGEPLPHHAEVARPRPRRRWIVPGAIAAAAVLVIALTVVLRDDERPTVSTFGDAATDIALAADAGLTVADVPLFVGGADVAATARAYLQDRFSSRSAEFAIADPVTSAGRATVSYSIPDNARATSPFATGTIRLRLDGASWVVVSASTDGIRFDDLRYDGTRLRGSVTTAIHLDPWLAVDVLDERGVAVPGAPRPEGLGAPLAGFLYGTAGAGTGLVAIDVAASGVVIVRASLIGGGRLTISEHTLALPDASDPGAPIGDDDRLTCSDATTATLSLDAGVRVFLDQVSLSGGTTDRALQTTRSGLADPSQRLWSKVGLLTYGERELTLEVPEGQSYWFGWGSSAEPAKKLTLEGCTGAAWTVFVGGFWTDAPKCVDLIVRTGGREETVAVGLGDPCPGQLPPDGPTER